MTSVPPTSPAASVSSFSTTAAQPNGTCSRCGGITYENLSHACTSNVAPGSFNRPFLPPGLTQGPWGFPIVKGRCPSCGAASLFLASGGHVTCAVIECENPTAVDDWLHEESP